MTGPARDQPRRAELSMPGTYLRMLGTWLALGLVFFFTPIHEVIAAAGEVGIWVWLGVVAATLSLHLFTAFKWAVLVRATDAPLPFSTAVPAHYAGLFANIWMPSIVGGDVIRATIAARAGGKLSGPTAAGIVDRMLDLLALVLIAGVGLAFAAPAQGGLPLLVLEFGGGAAIAGATALFIVLRYFEPERWLPQRIGKALGHLKGAARALVDRGETWAIAFLISVGAQCAFVGLNVALGHAVGIESGFEVWAVAWCLAKVAAFAPVSLGGFGVREAALTGLLAAFGVDPSLAVAQGLLWYGCLLAVGLSGGMAFLMLKPVLPAEDDPQPATS